MKIIGTDNFDRESMADSLVAENIKNAVFAEVMCKAAYCKRDDDPVHYKVVDDNYSVKARHGGFGMNCSAGRGMAWRGWARLGRARLGKALLGKAWQGTRRVDSKSIRRVF